MHKFRARYTGNKQGVARKESKTYSVRDHGDGCQHDCFCYRWLRPLHKILVSARWSVL